MCLNFITVEPYEFFNDESFPNYGSCVCEMSDKEEGIELGIGTVDSDSHYYRRPWI